MLGYQQWIMLPLLSLKIIWNLRYVIVAQENTRSKIIYLSFVMYMQLQTFHQWKMALQVVLNVQ